MNRRDFLVGVGAMAPGLSVGASTLEDADETGRTDSGETIRLFLGGDVMTGRGIDQILPHPGNPRLYESYVTSALRYVELAERANGPIPRPATVAYPWGDALAELDQAAPDARIINLETSVTTSDDHWPNKPVLYRMHPANVGCLNAAKIDCCVLANNHILDWGYAGLEETLTTLADAGVRTAGVGPNLAAATEPAVLDIPGKGRILVFAYGSPTSGIPRIWGATDERAGVRLLADSTELAVREVAEAVAQFRRPGDVVVASIHWGSNWGYDIGEVQRDFFHQLIDSAGVHVVHGHSSHHFRGIEVRDDRPILYGCGDLLNDYEGIGGYEQFRSELALLYFVDMDPGTGRLLRFEMTPVQIRNLRLNHPSDADVLWMRDRLTRECARFGHRVERSNVRPSRLRLTDM